MDLYVLDKEFKAVALLDNYISLIWTDRYYEAGDFEAEFPADHESIGLVKPNYYIWRKGSEHIMIVEHYIVTTDPEHGNTIKLKGRSAEALLCRRVMYKTATVEDIHPHELVKQLLKDNFVEPEMKNRQTDIFHFVEPTDKEILEMEYSANYNGETVYDAIANMCMGLRIGFKILLENGVLNVYLYKGADRSYAQTENPWIIYSPKFNNLLDTRYEADTTTFANVAIICGEEASQTINPSTGQVFMWPQYWTYIELDDEATGLDRCEVLIDCRDVSRWQGDYTWGLELKEDGQTHGWKKLHEYLYDKVLKREAALRMGLHEVTATYEASADTNMQWEIDKDMNMGDIVQVENEYGIQKSCRIVEIIYSHDVNGLKYYPTFLGLDEEDEALEGM